MNLTSVAAFRPTMALRPAPARIAKNDPTPAPAPAPTPAPTNDIDFSNIDTPQKAALLPALNAAAFLLNLNALSSAAQGGMALTSALTMTLGQNTQLSVNYQMADPTAPALAGTGTAGSAPFTETWALDPTQGLTISGNVGGSAEKLALTQADDGSTHIDGTIGGFAVHETVTAAADGSNGLVFDGTIGDQKLHQALNVNQPANGSNGPTTISVNGTLGNDAITIDEQVTSQSQTGLSLSGKGSIAGTPLTMTQTFAFAAPSGPSNPGPGNPGPGNPGNPGNPPPPSQRA
jgi:hypothetical protein